MIWAKKFKILRRQGRQHMIEGLGFAATMIFRARSYGRLQRVVDKKG